MASSNLGRWSWEDGSPKTNMANAGRGGVGQPVSPAWTRRKKQRGLGAHVSKFSRRKLCQVFLPHQGSPTWIQLRCASFPFRPGGPGPLCPSWESHSVPGLSFFSFVFFCPVEKSFVQVHFLASSPLPAHSGCRSAAYDGLRFIWTENWLGRLDRTAATTPGHSTPDNNYARFQAAEGTSEARQAGLSSVWSTRPVVQSRWRSVSVSPQSSRHGHWEALRLDRWSRSCPVLSACSSHHPLSHWSLDGRRSLVAPPAEGGQLVYFAPADSPVKCALHKCVSLFSLGVWDQPPPSATSNQGHSKLKAPPPPTSCQGTSRPDRLLSHEPTTASSNRLSGQAPANRCPSSAPGVVPYFGRFSRAACPAFADALSRRWAMAA